MTTDDNKACIACDMGIPERAKKCPHCHSWQTKLTLANSYQTFAVIVIIALAVLFGGLLFDIYYEIYRENISFSKFSDKFEVTDSKIHFSQESSQAYISCIGHVTNNTELTWENLTIEVQYFNASNELIDTITSTRFALVAPPMSSITFRVRGPADKTLAQYSFHKAIVRWAKIYD